MATIRNAPMEGADVRDYNMFIALCRGFHMGHMLGEWTCVDACLQILLLERPLRDAGKRRTVELFESCGPRVVTRQQYEDIVTAKREEKLEFEYNLGYVIEERFYAIVPPEAKAAIDEAGIVGIESIEDFISAIPEKYTGFYEQTIDEILRIHTNVTLPAACRKEDTEKVEPLLAEWKAGGLSTQDTMKLVDLLYVTGQQLCDCDELPEWKDCLAKYHRYLFADEDERFRHTYAVLEDCPQIWEGENGYYEGPSKPSEWVTRSTERLLGLIDHDDKPRKEVHCEGGG